MIQRIKNDVVLLKSTNISNVQLRNRIKDMNFKVKNLQIELTQSKKEL